MSEAVKYPKRLIEVDLPIRRVSEHSRQEKKVRQGHISSLHIWWARRPLAACRAVTLAALWPDPADESCPPRFLKEARAWLQRWAKDFPGKAGAESAARLVKIRDERGLTDDPQIVRQGLLDFIADFADWDRSNDQDFLAMSRALVQSAHECLGGGSGTHPLVIDPFAGGGAIPLEALRIGADAFASDINPLPVLLNKVVLEYVPRYGGPPLGEAVRRWGSWVRDAAKKELASFYPVDPDGTTPMSYIWTRTIQCEGPGCGAEVPLLRSLWLAKKGKQSVAFVIVSNQRDKTVELIPTRGLPERNVGKGTVRRGSATCPVCKFTTDAERVRKQLVARRGGAGDARLVCVVGTRQGEQGRSYRAPTSEDRQVAAAAAVELTKRQREHRGVLSLVPAEPLPYLRSIFNIKLLGVDEWGQLFSPRQALALSTLSRLVSEAPIEGAPEFVAAVRTLLAFGVDKQADLGNSLVRWEPIAQCPRQLFGRQAMGIIWDFAEAVPVGESSGSWSVAIDGIGRALDRLGSGWHAGSASSCDATSLPLPDDIANVVITDPPYYDSVPYADLADFFYVWLKRSLSGVHQSLLDDELTPKRVEIVQLAERNPAYAYKTKANFESRMRDALGDCRRVVMPSGIGVIVFAHKATDAWEAMLQAVVDGGWVVVGSWPIQTENESRLRAQGAAVLASSIHLVCRPRENPDGSLRTDSIGDWREVLSELPRRIHEWMPRLMEEGVVGADAIFACLGPALEVFSQYSRVEKASGEPVALKEYLQHVWAAVAKEALAAIFAGAETGGFEEDARLTAMWLWTVAGATNAKLVSDQSSDENDDVDEDADDEEEDDESASKGKATKGFALEYDAARKIAQGLGAHLEGLESLVEVKKGKARLISVGERAVSLFGDLKDDDTPLTGRTKASAARAKKKQLTIGGVLDDEVEGEERKGPLGNLVPRHTATVLDRVHQGMILFGSGRGEALRRFLVEDGIGKDQRFWRLAQALNQLYPSGTDERRWVEGVMARKKGLGL